MKPLSKISRTVILLSIVSLFNDVASEMLYPIMPLYLQSIGFSVLLIGILEGIAEATAGLSKGFFGRLSDVRGQRLPFVRLGYFLSAISKPLMVIITRHWWVFLARTLDRLGKGVRTGARDALLSDEATPASKGAVFGFHRSMDTLGAAVGPVIALLFLYFYPGEYVILFYLAFLPGLVSVLITLVLKEKPRIDRPSPKGDGFFGFLTYVSRSNRQYKMLLTGLLLFALFNSSDIFLLLIVKHQGYSDTEMVGLYIFYNLVFALFSYPLGTLADKVGLKKMFIAGLIIFAITYSGIALSSERLILLLLFFFYGIYAACTEGVSKAWISNICDRSDTGTAIGTYEGLRSITTFFSSTIAGVIWIYFNPETMFLATAIAVLGIVLFFLKIPYAESTILNDS